MADYWIKLYLEILDDPKMAMMPDRAWRRTVELFLVAKKLNKDGHLPDTRQIAWLLRMNAEDLEHDLTQIASTGIITQEVGGWFIPKFLDRQSAVSGAERLAQFRERQHKQEYYGNETQLKRNVTQRTDTETEADTETETETEQRTRDPFALMQSMIERLTGFTPTQRDIIPITEFVKKGVIEDDILTAIEFLKSVSKTPRGAADLRGSVMTAFGKRTQAGNKIMSAGTPDANGVIWR
jgi:hypothetical protein